MTWNPYYKGDGVSRSIELPAPPPWRSFPRRSLASAFQPPEGLVEAVNAALHLRRPLLVTGPPGFGKSTLVESVALELGLGEPIRWHVTSRSTLTEALYRYDVLGRIHAQQLTGADQGEDDISLFMQLGPLGTALAAQDRSRALLIDEFDKSDFDLPGDLLDVLESGEFEIPELVRHQETSIRIRDWHGDSTCIVDGGRIRCGEFPFIVVTSNGERDFPAPFLRRCIRFDLPAPSSNFLERVVDAHLGSGASEGSGVPELVADFLGRLQQGDTLALDQLLNAVFLLQGSVSDERARMRLRDLLLRELSDRRS